MKRSVFFSGIFAVTALWGPGLAFECSIFPGEGSHRIQASGDEIVLRTAPTAQASVADTISPARGEMIIHSDVRFRTIIPGLFLAREDGAIHGTSYGRVFYLSRTDYRRGGSGYDTFSFSKGDTIEYLQYRAEGWTFLRINGVVVCAELLSERVVPLKEIRRPQLELWIQVVDVDDNPLGWYKLEVDQFFQPTAGCMKPGPEFLPDISHR